MEEQNEGSGEVRRRDNNIQRSEEAEMCGFKGCCWKQSTSELALIMRSCWGMEGYISAVNVFNMLWRRSAVTSACLASLTSHH